MEHRGRQNAGFRVALCSAFALSLLQPAPTLAQDRASGRKVHEMALFFTSKGWFNCSARAEQIAAFLGGDTANQMFVVNHPSEASSLVDVTLLVPSDGKYAAGNITFSLATPGCPAVYTITSLLEKSCPDTLAGLDDKKGYTEIGKSGHYIAQVNAGTVIRLSPQQNGCLRVQTEIVE